MSTKLSKAKAGWARYQEEVAAFFRILGLDAETNQPVEGVRGVHAIDVLVTGKLAGMDIQWLVECKQWRTRVKKSAVLAHQAIVADVGADRGFVMAEAGYQSGALRVARQSNTQLTSLAKLRPDTEAYVRERALASFQRRADGCRRRLGHFTALTGNGANSRTMRVLSGAGDVVALYGRLSAIETGLQAARSDDLPSLYGFDLATGSPQVAQTPGELIEGLSSTLDELELLCDEAEAAITAGPDGELLQEDAT